MKVEKIQYEIIKSYMKNEEKARRTNVCYMKGDVFYITFDGVLIYKVDHKDFYLNSKVCDPSSAMINTISELFNNSQYAFDLEFDHEAKLLNKKTGLLYLKKGEKEGNYFCIDKKLMKNFENYTLKGTKPNNPIYVYEEDVLVGVVFPIHYNKRC